MLHFSDIVMSFHVNYQKWKDRCDPTHCPICQNAPMPDGMEDLWELKYTWLNAEPRECLKGALHVTSKIHVVELFELGDQELLGFMKEVNLYARCLKKVLNAVKINYEIHGNTIPHLHVHLYPRMRDDPYPNQAIDYSRKSPDIYSADEFQSFVTQMKTEITHELINLQ